MEQSFKEFEIICVDDNLLDGSYEKLLLYEKKLNNIRVYHNFSNISAAASRNKGLQYANGKYVIFIDSDDICHQEFLKELFIEAESKNADVVFCNYNLYENINVSYKWSINSTDEERRFDLLKKH